MVDGASLQAEDSCVCSMKTKGDQHCFLLQTLVFLLSTHHIFPSKFLCFDIFLFVL